MTTEIDDIEEIHWLAVLDNKDSYRDPMTGYKVMTSLYLSKRGKCCGNGCRHCPYNHVNVKGKGKGKGKDKGKSKVQ